MDQTGNSESPKRQPGRPRENKLGRGKGNPMLQIRFSPEDLARIHAKGTGWAKQVLLRALECDEI